MAVAFQTAATASVANEGTQVTCGKPTGTVDNDLLVAIWCVRYTTQRTLTLPTGWTEIARAEDPTPNNPAVVMARKVAASEGASYVFTASDTTNGMEVHILRFDDEDTTTPSDVAASTNYGNGVTLTATGITTVTDGAMLVAGFGVAALNSFAAPTGMSTAADTNAAARIQSDYVIQATAGASGDKVTGAMGATRRWGAILWAIRPSGGAAAIPLLPLLGVG